MNKDLPAMIEESLTRGFRVLVLTNAMRPLHHRHEDLLAIRECHGDALGSEYLLIISLERNTKIFRYPHLGADDRGPRWLAANNFNLYVAGRTCWDETDNEARAGYRAFFQSEDISIDVDDRRVLFVSGNGYAVDVPEITVHCWDILGVEPETIMCATSRMIVQKRVPKAPCRALHFAAL